MALTVPAEAYELSTWARRVGADDPLPYLRDLSLIDTDTIRRVGVEVWGGHELHSPARINLEDEAAALLRHLYADLSPDWEDDAYPAFAQHMEATSHRMDATAAHFSTVGDVLVAIADEFELRWFELIGLIVGAVGVIVSVVGLVVALKTGWTGVGAVVGLVVAVIGLLVSLVGLLITYLASVVPRLEALIEASERLDRVAPPMRWVEPESP